MIANDYSGSVDAIFSKYLMSDAENIQRNKELKAGIKKLYPKIGYIKVNGVYLGGKEPSFLIYALQGRFYWQPLESLDTNTNKIAFCILGI